MAKAKKEKAPSSAPAPAPSTSASKSAAASAAKAPASDPSEAIILNYLKAQNRPYGAPDIFNNLHGAVGKTLVPKVLATLAERGEITCKAWGKQLIYAARQDLLPVPSTEELHALDDKINSLKESLQAEKEAHKAAHSKLATMNSSLTTAELQDRIGRLGQEVKEMEERLEPLERGSVKIDPEERGRIEQQLERCTKAWKLRKKSCMEIVGMLTESSGQKPSVLMEELGMETDPVK